MKKTNRNHKISYRNTSPYGWWLASYIEQAIWDDQKLNLNSKCKAWENTIILKAPNRASAYKKVMKLSKLKSSFTDADQRRTGRWVFLGISELLPIHDKLEDGAEILWKEYNRSTVKSIRAKVIPKSKLSVFNDKK